VPLHKEQRAITRGEELGFTSREPTETKERKGEGKGTVMLWTRPRSGKLEVRWGRDVGLAFGSQIEPV
jgi:hypothetical protein